MSHWYVQTWTGRLAMSSRHTQHGAVNGCYFSSISMSLQPFKQIVCRGQRNAQWLGMHTALTKALGLIPSTH